MSTGAERPAGEIVALLQGGRVAEAADAAAALLRARPGDATALELAGLVAYEQQRLDEAAELFTRAVRADRRRHEAWINLGWTQLRAGRPAEAQAAFRRALALRPDAAQAHNALGAARLAAGERVAALESFRRAVQLAPAFAAAHANLANALIRTGQAAPAAEAAARAVELEPEAGAWRFLLGEARRHAGDARGAEQAYREALMRAPELAGALVNLGALLAAERRYDEALAELERAAADAPGLAEAHYNLGNTLRALGRIDAALAAYERALALAPEHLNAAGNRLLALNYSDRCSREAVCAEHAATGARLAAASAPAATAASAAPASTGAAKSGGRAGPRAASAGRLRVGFVSGDYREHSVAGFVAPLFAALDRRRFELCAVSNTARSDARTAALRARAERWIDIARHDDAAAARLLKQAGIEVLIDLSGYTAEHRLPLFARRAAPVQATWLGYPNTTGVPAIDWRIVDALTDPAPDAERYATERLLRLDGCFVCWEPPETPPLAARAADPARIRFGSFNNLSKVSATTIELWAGVLAAVPGSVLRLKAAGMDQPSVRQRLRAAFEARGIEAQRLEFDGWAESAAEHYAAYAHIDIALDTTPYNGTTTTCEALWMGVPVLAVAGDRHAARVGVSLLTHAGFPEWIATDAADYARRAAELAADPARLAALRGTLRERLAASALLDRTRHAAAFGRALERMAGGG
jgi:predicted O-linked N-acetylglucosamine transferase (SPINDLY family)